MKLLIVMTLLLALSACATTNPLAQANQACTAWGAAQTTTLKLAAAGKLSPENLKAFKQADAIATPACTGAPPATSAEATALASKVATETAIIIAINKGK